MTSELLSTSVKKNIENIQKLLKTPSDLNTREFYLSGSDHLCGIVYISGLVDKEIIRTQIRNLQMDWSSDRVSGIRYIDKRNKKRGLDDWLEQTISIGDAKIVKSEDELILSILSGDTAFFVEGFKEAIVIESKGWKQRSIEEPVTESVVRGPRDGFNENIRTNAALIRRRIRDTNLRFESIQLGQRSKKESILIYMEDIAHPDLVKEVKRRLNSIDIDDVAESGIIEEWIQDSFLSPFPQIMNTERPDKVSAAVNQGKIGILLDGTPFALIVPITFSQVMQSPEDYYERWMISSLIRSLRMGAAFIAIFLPSIYIALVSFHPGMIPSKLAFSIAATREGVPFPAVIEAFLMELTMELLREAGIRLPKPIGQTIGIVGGLVIGEAAVSAGIVSPIMVIVVALTAISSFSIPSYSAAISFRVMRFGMMLAAASFGFFGIILVYIMINIHISNLKSFGIPYTTPYAPLFIRDFKDLILRAPATMLNKRPQMMQTKDNSRHKNQKK